MKKCCFFLYLGLISRMIDLIYGTRSINSGCLDGDGGGCVVRGCVVLSIKTRGNLFFRILTCAYSAV